ncbi:ATP-binding cassette domain-containing protein [uncultured Sphaerochaeta sp.]|uniref:ATP-binding cassette domain-containing protein n=1 Tax=uncultured Sphaerochaeta sp. TaxID=886478 RepID=UPI002A0A415A|nr:ATP-binding cassette domain-containing protein [uncultured Sphaerochaeta sp.]
MNTDTQSALNAHEIFIQAKGISKTFGYTVAVNDLNITINKGEVLALIGANGAGKSTLTNLLSGVIPPDAGEMVIEGSPIDFSKYSPYDSKDKGIRVVHQELSLCKNLSVYENFFIENGQEFKNNAFSWRKQARKMSEEALQLVFPGNSINVNAILATLTIAQQQMVEIVRAFCDKKAKLFILDEPTSSLPCEETEQLVAYIKDSVTKGQSYVFISHRLQEVMDLADRVFIMQNGKEKYQCTICDTDIEDMVTRMGDGKVEKTLQTKNKSQDIVLNSEVEVTLNHFSAGMLKTISCDMHGGEIIGITGLEGNGQLELLKEIFFNSKRKLKQDSLQIKGKVAFIAGDRKKEGIFPLWSISDNTIITEIAEKPLLKILSKEYISDLARKWNKRLNTKCNSYDDAITCLSGGNQQKVLIARALASDADIILLDDPTKGVDVKTKQELYSIFQEAANNGKLIIWRSSDDAELEYCSHLYVMSSGKIIGNFTQEEFDHSIMLKLSFGNLSGKVSANKGKKKIPNGLFLFSLIASVVLYVVCGTLSPAVFSKFGIELLAIGFTPFIFGALAQTFIIGLGHIDLGVGAYMGLVNVVCATLLHDKPLFGFFVLLLLLLSYSSMGLLVCWKKIPPIIVTLSLSFVWTGLAYVLQDVPGGEVPQWLLTFFNFNNPLLQGILLWLLLFIALAISIYRSRYGTVLRGFGNNEGAMINSGWSRYKAYWITYLIAGCFAFMGGIAESSIIAASDINAMSTYTILTVAAVIIGGGYFSGGVVTHVGSVLGSIVLTLVSILLGLLRVSTDYTATIQGFVLIIILSLRLFQKEKKQ